jgi:hypothetical protein
VGLVWSIIVVAGKRKAYGALVASGIGLILLIVSGALARVEGGFMVGLLAGLAGLGLSIFALVRRANAQPHAPAGRALAILASRRRGFALCVLGLAA